MHVKRPARKRAQGPTDSGAELVVLLSPSSSSPSLTAHDAREPSETDRIPLPRSERRCTEGSRPPARPAQ